MNIQESQQNGKHGWLRSLHSIIPFVLLIVLRGASVEGPRDFITLAFLWLWGGISVLLWLKRVPNTWILLALPIAAFTIFEMNIGSYSLGRDVAVPVVSLALAILVSKTMRGLFRIPKQPVTLSSRSATFFALRALVFTWVTLYASGSISRRIGRDQNELRDWRKIPNAWPKAHLAVTLSGGGYRAAVFHAGVLRGLEYMSIRPSALSTVSGGSIIGAYYARGGNPESLGRLVAGGAFNVRREILAPWNLARLVLSMRVPGTEVGWLPIEDFSRTDIQAQLLSQRLLGNTSLRDSHLPEAPEYVLCATDLISGSMIGLFRGGVMIQPRLSAGHRERFLNDFGVRDALTSRLVPARFDGGIIDRPLSLLVAASGAFPVAFNPVRVGTLSTPDYLLADGGLTDNLGLAMANVMALNARYKNRSQESENIPRADSVSLRVAANIIQPATANKRLDDLFADLSTSNNELSEIFREWKVDVVLVSDASALPVEAPARSTLAVLGRAVDAVYRATGGTTGLLQAGEVAVPGILVSPATLLPTQLKEYELEMLREGDTTYSVLSFKYGRSVWPVDGSRYHQANQMESPGTFDQLRLTDLRRIAEMLPEPDRSRAVGLLPLIDTLVRLGNTEDSLSKMAKDPIVTSRGNGTKINSPPQPISNDPLGLFLDSTRVQWRRGQEADVDLYELIRRQLSKDLFVFMGVSTLEDRMDQQTVTALMRLGEVLVILNRHLIEKQLSLATKSGE